MFLGRITMAKDYTQIAELMVNEFRDAVHHIHEACALYSLAQQRRDEASDDEEDDLQCEMLDQQIENIFDSAAMAQSTMNILSVASNMLVDKFTFDEKLALHVNINEFALGDEED
jgi:hypothetical protein